VVPGCLALAWWQASRALSGNTLSWAYTFEWPLFAGYAVYMWWKLLHDEPAGPGEAATPGTAAARVPAAGAGSGPGADRDVAGGSSEGEDDDGELAAYNRYLAELNASGRRKHW
jgi:hypothetical protein